MAAAPSLSSDPRGRPTPTDRLLAGLRSANPFAAVVWLVGLLTLCAWATGIFHRYWDYDEIEHAHAAWMIRRGLRPFTDFFEAHPPFGWYPMATLNTLWGDSYGLLFAYRVATGVGHLLFLAAVAKNLALSFSRRPTPARLPLHTFVLCAAVVAADPAIVDYLLELRMDAWPNALLMYAVYRYRHAMPVDRRAFILSAAQFGFLAAAAVVLSPKLAVFLACFLIASLASADHRSWRLVGMASGAITCLLLGALILLVTRVDFVLFFKSVYPYHRLLNKNAGFDYGLFSSVVAQKTLLAVVCISATACLLMLGRRVLLAPFELAVLGFSVLQLVMVSFRFKQYYGPWFLLTVTFIPYLELALRRARPLHAVALATAVIFALTNAQQSRQAFGPMKDATTEIEFREMIEAQVPKDGLVLAPEESMPIFRRSALFHHVTSFAPSGYGTEPIMKELGLGEKFTEEFYQRELEQKKPAAIVVTGAFTDAQRRAMDSYLKRFEEKYRRTDTTRGPVLFRQP